MTRFREEEHEHRLLRAAAITLLAVGVLALAGTLLVRDQISRHSRELFSPHQMRRLAALGYLAGHDATVDAVLLLRDYVAWETKPMLRKRAASILSRMEGELAIPGAAVEAL
jgi:hypothetical protein